MRSLMEEDEDGFKRQFGQYAKHGITADELEDIYKTAHQKIREDPSRAPKVKKTYEKPRRFNAKRLTIKQRKNRVTAQKNAWLARIQKGEVTVADIC